MLVFVLTIIIMTIITMPIMKDSKTYGVLMYRLGFWYGSEF